MKQIFLHKGQARLEEVPSPTVGPESVLVAVSHSLISTGTEIASVKLSGQSLLTKARQQPSRALTVLASLRQRGLRRTFTLVRGRMEDWQPLGYSAAGTVMATGEKITDLKPGDRVACGGAGLANHAEEVAVPRLLIVPLPKNVSTQAASFVTVGAIALQGVRRSETRVGEVVCVIGLGLIGQLTVQLLRAGGCRVVGVDPDPRRIERARSFGLLSGAGNAAALRGAVNELTDGAGCDATLITASTPSSAPAQSAFEITRKKGRIVIVGAVGMNLRRSPFYEREQDFLISCSYGPGRYDPDYEQHGCDYPYDAVRWTENRNMSAFLEGLSSGRIAVESLIEREVSPSEAPAVFSDLARSGGDKPLAVVIRYDPKAAQDSHAPRITAGPIPKGKLRVGLIGVGDFARATHIPNLQAMDTRVAITAVCAATGASALATARRVNAPIVATDPRALFENASVDAVVISTRHNHHADIAAAALRAGKHVYLEKPAALVRSELDRLAEAVRPNEIGPTFMVGFNRRFAPSAVRLKKIVKERGGPLSILFRVNAETLRPDHWGRTEEGGGRLRGEACHMIDFFQFLTGSSPASVGIEAVRAEGAACSADENFSAVVRYADGSVGTLVYTTLGNNALSKENILVSWPGGWGEIDDFSALRVPGSQGWRGRQDKGHVDAMTAFVDAIGRHERFPIPWTEIATATEITFCLDDALVGAMNTPL